MRKKAAHSQIVAGDGREKWGKNRRKKGLKKNRENAQLKEKEKHSTEKEGVGWFAWSQENPNVFCHKWGEEGKELKTRTKGWERQCRTFLFSMRYLISERKRGAKGEKNRLKKYPQVDSGEG